MSRRVLLVALALAALVAVPGPPAQALGPNLVKNPGFEVPLAIADPVFNQPGLPADWTVEGAAGLFDHTPHGPRSGQYAAAISIVASGKRQQCVGQVNTCVPFAPVNQAKDSAATHASVTPAWRTAPITIQAGRTYQVSGGYRWDNATATEGGILFRVRWLDANGVGIRVDEAFRRVAPANNFTASAWAVAAGNVVAPGNAKSAVVLVGTLDDLWTSHMVFDDVAFQVV